MKENLNVHLFISSMVYSINHNQVIGSGSFGTIFKAKALKLRQQGQSPSQIFIAAGINLSLFGAGYAKKCLHRWEKMSAQDGGLKKDRRGSKSKGRPKGKKFKSLEDENAYLRAENDFLKKLRALEARYANKKNSR